MRNFLAALICMLAGPAFAQGPFASFERASEPFLSDPHDLAFGPDGSLYVADRLGDRIAVLNPDTLELVDSFGAGTLAQVRDISFGPDGKAYAAATGLGAMAAYRFQDGKPDLEYSLTGFPRTEGILAHSNGRVYVMASGIGRLVTLEDDQPMAAVDGLFGAHDVAEAPDGSIWVADNARAQIVRLSEGLDFIEALNDPAYGFVGPRYLDVDDFGRLVVADRNAHRIQLIDPLTGELVGTLGDGTPGIGPDRFDSPAGVAVRGNSYYFSDSGNDRVVKYVVVTN